MIFRKYTVVLWASFIAILMVACGSPEQERMKFFNKGEVLYEKGEYVKARIEFKSALQIDPNFALAYHRVGQCEVRLKSWRQAFGFFNKAVELDPDLWEAHLSLAEMFMMARQVDKAKEKIAIVLDKHPEDSRALLLNSLILIRENKVEEAENVLRSVIEKDPEKTEAYLTLAKLMEKKLGGPEPEKVLKLGLERNQKNTPLLLALASLYTKRKDFPNAESIYKTLIEYYPDRKQYLILLAKFYNRINQPDKAEEICKDLIKDEPDNAGYRVVLAKFYDKQKRTDKAIEVLKKAAGDFPEELKLQLLLGEMYLKNKQVDQSLKTHKDLAENNPLKPEAFTARNRMARTYFVQRKIDLAKSQLDIVLKENPKDIEAHSLRGTILLGEGKGLEAVGEFRVVVQEKPDDLKGYVSLARAHLLNKEKALALDTLKKAVNINPQHKKALDLILRLYARDNSYDDAIALLKIIVDKYPGNLFAVSRLGDFYLIKGNLEQAGKNFLQLKEKAPKNPEGFIKMSLVYGQKKDYAAAERELDGALALQPKNLNILTKSLDLQMFLKRPERALKKCMDQIKKTPSAEPGIRMLMSRIYSAQKKFTRAEQQIKKAIKLKPNSVVPYSVLGNLYLRQGKIDQGIEEFKSALNRKPDAVQLKFTIATLYGKKKDYDEALKWYERIVDEHPKFIPALNNLAYTYANRYPSQKNLDRSLKLIKDIPEELLDASTLDTLGWVYFQREEYGKAIEVFKHTESKADTPLVQLHLGLAYLKMNQVVEARDALEKALKDGGKGLSKEDKKLAEKAWKSLEG